MTISTTDTHPALRWGSASGGFAESDPRGGAVLGMSGLVAGQSNPRADTRHEPALDDAQLDGFLQTVPGSSSAAPIMGLAG